MAPTAVEDLHPAARLERRWLEFFARHETRAVRRERWREPDIKNGHATINLSQNMTAGFSLAGGHVAWRTPGTYICGLVPCPGASAAGYSSPSGITSPTIGVRLIETGTANARRRRWVTDLLAKRDGEDPRLQSRHRQDDLGFRCRAPHACCRRRRLAADRTELNRAQNRLVGDRPQPRYRGIPTRAIKYAGVVRANTHIQAERRAVLRRKNRRVRRPIRSEPVHSQRRCLHDPSTCPKLHRRGRSKRRRLDRLDYTQRGIRQAELTPRTCGE